MRQIRVSGFVRSDLPAEISMSHVGSNPMFQTFCQQSSATVTAKKGGKQPFAAQSMNDQKAAIADVGFIAHLRGLYALPDRSSKWSYTSRARRGNEAESSSTSSA